MTATLSRWITAEINDRELDGYARERVEEELQSDPAMAALWKAQRETDVRQSGMRPEKWKQEHEGEEPLTRIEARDFLLDARRACDDALDALADEIVRETVEHVDVHGHTVNLTHARRVDCPGCEESGVEAYYLGDAGDVVGWVCGHCGGELREDRESGEIEAAPEGSA